jgi:hypothetical protein
LVASGRAWGAEIIRTAYDLTTHRGVYDVFPVGINGHEREFFYAIVKAKIKPNGIGAGLQQHSVDFVNVDFEGFDSVGVGRTPGSGPVDGRLQRDEIRTWLHCFKH